MAGAATPAVALKNPPIRPAGTTVALRDADGVAGLYNRDPGSRLAILGELAGGESPGADTIIPCDSGGGIGEALCILCLKFPGASEEGEPLVAAGMISRVARESHPLPMISEDRGTLLCAKTLVSLALFLPAMISRWKRRGAPAPEFYRNAAVGMLRGGPTIAHKALSAHHRGWEDFLHEQLCPGG